MAIGDKAAAHGLQVFPSTQDRRLGYQNDNQRGDDIADVMDRATALENNAKTPNPVQNATPITVTAAKGSTTSITQSTVLAKQAYPRNVRINWRALVVAASTGDTYADVFVVQTINGVQTQLTGARIYGAGSGGGSFDDQIPANTAVSYRLTCNPSNGSASVTGDSRFTQLQISARAIA